MRCRECNCLLDRHYPDRKEYVSYCFICDKYYWITNTFTNEDRLNLADRVAERIKRNRIGNDLIITGEQIKEEIDNLINQMREEED